MSSISLFLALPAAIALVIPLLFPFRWLPLYLIPVGSWLAYNLWQEKYNPMAFDGPAGWLAVALIGTLLGTTIISIVSILSAELIKRLTGKTRLLYVPTRIIFLLFFIGLYGLLIGAQQDIKSASNTEPTVACLQSITPVIVGNELLNVPIHPGFGFFNKHEPVYGHGSPRRINEFCETASSQFSRSIEVEYLMVFTKELHPYDTWNMPNCSAPGRFSWMDKLCGENKEEYRKTIPEFIRIASSNLQTTKGSLYELAHNQSTQIIDLATATAKELNRTGNYRLKNGDVLAIHCFENGYICNAIYKATSKLYVSFEFQFPKEQSSIPRAIELIEMYNATVREIAESLLPH